MYNARSHNTRDAHKQRTYCFAHSFPRTQQRLDMDMERVCAYIEQEIDQSTSIREQKLLVAEFGLLDAQLSTLLTMLQASEVSFVHLGICG